MSEIYILGEMPVLDSPPTAQQQVYLVIPSLNKYLFAREHGITAYGSDSPPFWSIITHGYTGKSAFDHWMNSRSIPILARLFALVLFKWIWTRRISEHGWTGKAIIVSGQTSSEIHFLVYSEVLDVSLDLHLQLREQARYVFERGLSYLGEIHA